MVLPRIPILSDAYDKLVGSDKLPPDIETPAIPPPPDFSNINQSNYSDAYYRFLQQVAHIESKADLLKGIEESNLSRQSKNGLITFIKNELDQNMMYSDLSEGEDKAISHLKSRLNVFTTCILPARKSDRKNPIFVYIIENVLSQAWHITTRATGKDRERTITGKVHLKYEGATTIQKGKEKQ